MSTFSQLPQQIRIHKPDAVVQIAPRDWHAEWPDKPSTTVAVGLRCISELDTSAILAQAATAARDLFPDADHDDPDLVEAFNGLLMRLAVARATCKPEDAVAAFFDLPDDQIAEAWLPSTIRRLWDELERVTIETSCVREPAADDELAELNALIVMGRIDSLSAPAELRLRKLLAFCLSELRAAAPPTEE